MTSSMTFREAAITVLTESGVPMKLGDIWAAISSRGLVETDGKTPESSLATILLRASVGSGLSSQSAVKHFVRTAPNTFGLVTWSLPVPAKKPGKAPRPHADWKVDRAKARRSPEAARDLMALLIADEDDRHEILRATAKLLASIHAIAPRAWSVTMRRRELSILAGSLLFVWFRKDRVTITIDGGIADAGARSALNELERLPNWSFKSAPDLQGIEVSSADYSELCEALAPAVVAAVKHVVDRDTLSKSWRQHSPGFTAYLREATGLPVPDPELPDSTDDDEPIDLEALVREFATEYAATPKGTKLLDSYKTQREAGRANFEKAKAAKAAGKDYTADVLDGLLPHRDTKNNRARGAWTHVAPAITKELREWYEASGLYQPSDWPTVATALLDLFETVDANPDALPAAIDAFKARAPRGFRSGFLSPAWNALRPERFLVINKKTIEVINALSGTRFKAQLADYLKLNALGWKQVEVIRPLLPPSLLFYEPGDVFDHFCHWLVAEKEYFEEDDDEEDDDNGDVDDLEFEAAGSPPPPVVSPPPPTPLSYFVDDASQETGYAATEIEAWLRIWRAKHHLVLQGPPGTGKTFVAKRLARLLAGNGLIELVQFHPAYSYEDFIQGLRPRVVEGQLEYRLEPGRFLQFCERARHTHGQPAVLIIDEINRANVPRVFGELMYLLEYRTETAPLASGGTLSIPNNVYLLGTMNTADRSIARMDHALRRRFAFVRLDPRYDLLSKRLVASGIPAANVDALRSTLESLNEQIADPSFAVGISYFVRLAASAATAGDLLADIWRHEVEPYLGEYFHDDAGTASKFSWSKLTRADGPMALWAASL